MDWGLKNRISQIIKPNDNRALMLAVDHGYFLGPTEKLEEPRKVIAPILMPIAHSALSKFVVSPSLYRHFMHMCSLSCQISTATVCFPLLYFC